MGDRKGERKGERRRGREGSGSEWRSGKPERYLGRRGGEKKKNSQIRETKEASDKRKREGGWFDRG